MSFVTDLVQRIDCQLSRLPPLPAPASADSTDTQAKSDTQHRSAPGTTHIQDVIRSLSTSSNKKRPLSRARLHAVLEQARIMTGVGQRQGRHTNIASVTATVMIAIDPSHENEHVLELEWLLLSKITVYVYGFVLDAILNEMLSLADNMWYWDGILASVRRSAVYSAQSGPLRLWMWTKAIYNDIRQLCGGDNHMIVQTLARNGWGYVYGLVLAARQRQLNKTLLSSPISQVRSEGHANRNALERIRLVNATALGVLLDQGLANRGSLNDGMQAGPSGNHQYNDSGHLHLDHDDYSRQRQAWKGAVIQSIALMEAVLREIPDPNTSAEGFDDAVAVRMSHDYFYQIITKSDGSLASVNAKEVTQRLTDVLDTHLSGFQAYMQVRTDQHGRPSGIIRYWLPATVLLVSSTTLYRIAMGRRTEILALIHDLDRTIMDFFNNWILEPTKRIISTIHHHEVLHISEESLQGDRASLERMVVDFVMQSMGSKRLTERQIADVRQKVREGDLTLVLKAYEKDMQRPIVGAISGNLIHALLIQVQKAKVDIELAMAGIDSILQSQKLLFGFMGLTPGLMVCVGIARYLQSTFSSRKGVRKSQATSHITRLLRNIDRILTRARPTRHGELSYQDYGLLLCELHVLRPLAGRIMPAHVFLDFVEELDELADMRAGIAKQHRIVMRMRWAYAKWL